MRCLYSKTDKNKWNLKFWDDQEIHIVIVKKKLMKPRGIEGRQRDLTLQPT